MNVESSELLHFPVSIAGGDVVIDHADGLHEGIADRRSDEGEAAPLEILAHGAGNLRLRRHLAHRLEAVLLRLVPDEAPDILGKTPELLLHFQEDLRVPDRPLDLEPVADDAGVDEQTLDLLRPEAGDLRRIEATEDLAIAVAFPQHRDPCEPRLGALQNQELEERAVVPERHPPLLVVIGLVEGIVRSPVAALLVGFGHGRSSSSPNPRSMVGRQHVNIVVAPWKQTSVALSLFTAPAPLPIPASLAWPTTHYLTTSYMGSTLDTPRALRHGLPAKLFSSGMRFLYNLRTILFCANPMRRAFT